MARWHFGATQSTGGRDSRLTRCKPRGGAARSSPDLGADEHMLMWRGGPVAGRARGDERQQNKTDDLALNITVTAILPHLLKRIIDQERRDRCMVHRRVMTFPVRASATMLFRPAMPCMLARSRPPSPGPIPSWLRSRGDLAASLQRPGSSCWRTGRPTCSQASQWEPWWNGVCGRCPDGRTRRTRRRARRA